MHTYPYQLELHEPTKKQIWLASFTALLAHMQPEEAVEAADRALKLCDKRWEAPEWVRTWQYEHNYPIGHRFAFRPAVPGDNTADGLAAADAD